MGGSAPQAPEHSLRSLGSLRCAPRASIAMGGSAPQAPEHSLRSLGSLRCAPRPSMRSSSTRSACASSLRAPASFARLEGTTALSANLSASTGSVLVARVAHPSWDADALAAGFSESEATRARRARHRSRDAHERARDEARRARRSPRRRAEARPCRGAHPRGALGRGGRSVRSSSAMARHRPRRARPRSRSLSGSRAVRCSCGEDGPAGSRFERARDRALQISRSSTAAPTRVHRRRAMGAVWRRSGAALDCDAVVLATGRRPRGRHPVHARQPHVFTLSYDAPVTLGFGGQPLVVPGSVFGVRAGVAPRAARLASARARGCACACPPRIFAAGDAVCRPAANAPRRVRLRRSRGTLRRRSLTERFVKARCDARVRGARRVDHARPC